jgi:hypothetical protein
MRSFTTPADDDEMVVTTLLMPRELRDWLRDHAKDQQRTMAGEVRYLVEKCRAEAKSEAKETRTA